MALRARGRAGEAPAVPIHGRVGFTGMMDGSSLKGGTVLSRQPGASSASALADRHHSRFGVSLPVRCERVTARVSCTWRGRTANVSGGGLAVDLPIRLPPRTRVVVEIRTGIGPLRMEADVLWTRRVSGKDGVTRHGLCMADRSEVMDLPIHAMLGEWLQSLARREAKELRQKVVRPRVRAPRGTPR